MDIKAYPTSNLFNWYVLGEVKDKNEQIIYEYNGLTRTSRYNETSLRLNIMSEGEDLNVALSAADELPQVKMFR